jgi:hypothetical protein
MGSWRTRILRPRRHMRSACAWAVVGALGSSATCRAQQPPSQANAGAVVESLSLVLDLPDSVWAGEVVPMRLTVVNRGPEAVELFVGRSVGARSNTVFDIHVFDANGRLVWRRLTRPRASDGFVVATIGVAESVLLAPSGTRAWWDTWHQHDLTGTPVGPGRYSVVGILPRETAPPLRSGPRQLVVR